MSRVRITVLRREIYEGLLAEHYAPYASERRAGRCSVFRDGQTFDTDRSCEKPQGFRDWAWADMQRDVASVSLGVGIHGLPRAPSRSHAAPTGNAL